MSARLDAARVGVGGERRLGLPVRVIELAELAVCLRQIGIDPLVSRSPTATSSSTSSRYAAMPTPHRLGHRLEIGIDQRRVVARRCGLAADGAAERDHDEQRGGDRSGARRAKPERSSSRRASAGGHGDLAPLPRVSVW